jgi:hypothetical protein
MERRTHLPRRARSWAAALALLAMGAGCGGERDAGAFIDAVQVKLDLGGGVTLTSVEYVLTGPNNFRRTGNLTVADDPTITATFQNLPPGMGYKLVVQGTGDDDQSVCKGQAMFSVAPMMNAVVQVALMCTGRAAISADFNNCPTIESLSVAPNEITVGASVQLASIAQDPDNGPVGLTATWSASSGNLTSLSTAGATFTCTAPGTFPVTLTISDGTPQMKCADTASVTIVCAPGGP